MTAVHPRVLGYLGRALSLELSAVQQYMTHASLAELWGDADAAQRFRQETVEEMQHAERLVQRMLSLGVAPAASQLRPVSHAADLIGHYGEAVRFCLLVGDRDSEAFFRSLWDEEQHHAEDLAAWMQALSPYTGLLDRARF